MPLKREELREFAVVGARARLVDLEKERQRLFAEFPELEKSYAAASGPEVERPTKRAPRKSAKPRVRPKKTERTLDRQAGPKTIAFLQEVEKPVPIIAVAQHFKLGTNAADQRLRKLAAAGVVKQVRKTVEGKSVNLWELTPKGEKMDVPVNGVS